MSPRRRNARLALVVVEACAAGAFAGWISGSLVRAAVVAVAAVILLGAFALYGAKDPAPRG